MSVGDSMAEPVDDSLLNWSPLTAADLPELASLVEVIEYLDDMISTHALADIREAFHAPGADPGRNAIVGRDSGGCIVAYAWNQVQAEDSDVRRVLLTGGVHPAFRDQHIGSALLRWQIDRAKQWYAETHRPGHGPLKLIASVDENLSGARDLYVAAGLQPEAWYYDLHHAFSPDDPAAEPVLPPGYRLVGYPECEAEAVRLAHNLAFADKEGAHEVSAADWADSLRRSEARPDLSWVALAPDGSVAGYALNSLVEAADGEAPEGWTDRLGVIPEHRSRGIAAALLTACNRSFREAGCQGAGLGYDTTHEELGAELFARRGYEAVEVVVAHAVTFRD